ncbi:hypothetical protein BDR26DRAFT_901265 [Obelidium mucronatum]|nr:hypothetical protein BDR26DRAFT_901265 [Obelidium mucronatum]
MTQSPKFSPNLNFLSQPPPVLPTSANKTDYDTYNAAIKARATELLQATTAYMTLNPGQLMRTNILVNGTERWCLVDPGAMCTSIDAKWAKAAGIETSHSVKVLVEGYDCKPVWENVEVSKPVVFTTYQGNSNCQ